MTKVRSVRFCLFLFILAVYVLPGCKAENSATNKVKSGKADTYPRGYTFNEVPNPLSSRNPRYSLVSKSVPECGRPFTDDCFGTALTRVTQRTGIRHEYSRFDPFNVDQSMIILHFPSSGDQRVYYTKTMPYEHRSNLVRNLDLEEARWDPEDPNLIWGVDEFCLRTLDVKTGKTSTIKDFSEDSTIGPIKEGQSDLYRITMKDEGESSQDKRFWAFALQGGKEDYRLRYVFTWDRQKDKVLGLYKISLEESSIDWVGMSPKGNWVLIGGDSDNKGKLAGLTMANMELTQFHRLDFTTAHADVGLDADGNEVIVMQNVRTDYVDMIPIDLKTKPILETGGSYKNTNRTKLMRLYYSSGSPVCMNTSGIHISCNFPGYCVVSTHIEPGLKEQNWLDRTITLVKLDRDEPQVFYLAKLYNTTKEYWEETQATVTNDGSKVIWASNWNQNVGEEQVFLLQLDMPRDWVDSEDAES